MRTQKIIMLFIIIVFTSVSVFFAVMLSPPLSHASYAVIKIGSNADDEDIVFRLSSEGIEGIEAAATQKVFLNNFDDVKQIPLYQYDDHVFAFDPRNDGYGEKLKRFFSHNGEELIFIPLEKQALSSREIIKKIDEVLGSIPHELQFIGTAMPKKLPWLLFLTALLGILIFFKKLRPLAGIFLPMAGFLFFGASGFIFAALLTAFFSVLMKPINELLTSRFLGKKKGICEQISLYRYSCISALVFFALYIAVMLLTSVSVVFSAAMFASLSGLFVFCLQNKVKQDRASEHTKFLPVPIFGEKKNVLYHCVSALPFTIAAVILLFSPLFINQSGGNFAFDQSRLVTKADFEAHIRFQQIFSFIPLGKTGDNYQYRTYQLGDDGLVSDTGRPYSASPELLNMHSFPLEGIIRSIEGTPEQRIRWDSPDTFIPLVCFLSFTLFAVMVIIRNRGRKKIISMYNDKRIAA